jgi:hypothetical protein
LRLAGSAGTASAPVRATDLTVATATWSNTTRLRASPLCPKPAELSCRPLAASRHLDE